MIFSKKYLIILIAFNMSLIYMINACDISDKRQNLYDLAERMQDDSDVQLAAKLLKYKVADVITSDETINKWANIIEDDLLSDKEKMKLLSPDLIAQAKFESVCLMLATSTIITLYIIIPAIQWFLSSIPKK